MLLRLEISERVWVYVGFLLFFFFERRYILWGSMFGKFETMIL